MKWRCSLLVWVLGVVTLVEFRVPGLREGAETSVLKVLLAHHLHDPRMGPTWWWLLLLKRGRCNLPAYVEGGLCFHYSPGSIWHQAVLMCRSHSCPGSLIMWHGICVCLCIGGLVKRSCLLIGTLKAPALWLLTGACWIQHLHRACIAKHVQTDPEYCRALWWDCQTAALFHPGSKRGIPVWVPCKVPMLCGLWLLLGSIRPCLVFSIHEMITAHHCGDFWCGVLAVCLHSTFENTDELSCITSCELCHCS